MNQTTLITVGLTVLAVMLINKTDTGRRILGGGNRYFNN